MLVMLTKRETMMNIVEYQAFCEDFFKQDMFASNETLAKEIAHLSAEEFKEWNQNLIAQYDQKYEFIRAMIKDMRDKENFVTSFEKINYEDIDWDKDPIKKEENKTLITTYRHVYEDVFDKEIKKFTIYLEKSTQLEEYFKQRSYQQSLQVEVDGKDFVAEKVIDVFWSGWECDDKVWLVVDEGQKKIVASNHGQTHFADKQFLEDKIKEYQQAINDTQDLLNQL